MGSVKTCRTCCIGAEPFGGCPTPRPWCRHCWNHLNAPTQAEYWAAPNDPAVLDRCDQEIGRKKGVAAQYGGLSRGQVRAAVEQDKQLDRLWGDQ